MASGSAGHPPNSSSKSFDFGSDDILCSHEDYGNQDGSNGIHSDPAISAKVICFYIQLFLGVSIVVTLMFLFRLLHCWIITFGLGFAVLSKVLTIMCW